jgi:hypothetical protein
MQSIATAKKTKPFVCAVSRAISEFLEVKKEKSNPSLSATY